MPGIFHVRSRASMEIINAGGMIIGYSAPYKALFSLPGDRKDISETRLGLPYPTGRDGKICAAAIVILRPQL